MKIKIFSGDNAKSLENSINRFIKDKNVVGINQSESVNEACTPHFNLTITVLYDEFYRYDYVNSKISRDSF